MDLFHYGGSMRILTHSVLNKISGGNPFFVAVGVGAATYAGAATIISSTQTLSGFGQNVGEAIFNATHPDQLGQMIYTEKDFK